MGLFTKREKTQIATLEQLAADTISAHATELQETHVSHRKEVEQLRLQIVQLLRSVEEDEKDKAAAALGHQLEAAHLQGQIEALKDKGRKYDGMVQGHTWHSGGSVEVEGKKYRLMEARTDNPLANFRLPVPEGQEFP